MPDLSEMQGKPDEDEKTELEQLLDDPDLEPAARALIEERIALGKTIAEGLTELAKSRLGVPESMFDAVHTEVLMETLLGPVTSETRQAFHRNVERRILTQLVEPMLEALPQFREDIAAMEARATLLGGMPPSGQVPPIV